MTSADPLRNLGVPSDQHGGELRVWSENADGMELCLFDDNDPNWLVKTVPMTKDANNVWVGTLAHPHRSARATPSACPARRARRTRSTRRPCCSTRTRAASCASGRTSGAAASSPTASTGATPQARRPARPHGHLRGAREGHQPAQPGRPGGAARHLRRPRARVDDRLPERPRRHGGRAAAGARVRLRAAPAPAGPDELLGLQHPQLLHPARRRTPRARRRRRDRMRCSPSSRAW